MDDENKVRGLRELLAWQKRIELTQVRYPLTRDPLFSCIHELQKTLQALHAKPATTH